MKIILASQSPGRLQVLHRMGLDPDVAVSNFDEESVKWSDWQPNVEAYSQAIAMGKLLTIRDQYPDSIIIAGDLVVHCNNRNYGKPNDLTEAMNWMLELAGKKNLQVLGMHIAFPNGSIVSGSEVSTVTLPKNMSKSELDDYIAHADPLKKAGGISIKVAKRVWPQTTWEGNLSTIMGISAQWIELQLTKYGVSVPRNFLAVEKGIAEEVLA